MSLDDARGDLLMRYIDEGLSGTELSQCQAWLRGDAEARALLRDVAEQAVMVAELERLAAGRQLARDPRRVPLAETGRGAEPASARWRRLAVAVAFLAVACAAAAASFHLLPRQKAPEGGEAAPAVACVSRVTGSSLHFSARSGVERAPRPGAWLVAGDTLETRSCDAWIELVMRGGEGITVAGNSQLRILDAEEGQAELRLVLGALWGAPASGTAPGSLVIHTPTLTAELRGAQFDIQTSGVETRLRVNAGIAIVRQVLDGSAVEVTAGQRVAASLDRKGPLAVIPQPAPVHAWSCDLGRTPEVILGRWLPPFPGESARIGAEPLAWPVPGREAVMLYALALAAWKSTDHPVLLKADSRLRVRGRTERALAVRFGFSAQRMQGVFAGKFETDVPPEALGSAGAAWVVDLPLSRFHPLSPQLCPSPDGLELTDVYVLTVQEDAGLEIHHLELVPGDE